MHSPNISRIDLRYFATFPSPVESHQEENDDKQPIEKISKAKQLVKKNGPLVWWTYTYWGVYFGALGGRFCGIQSGS
jgi:hypothetical protein